MSHTQCHVFLCQINQNQNLNQKSSQNKNRTMPVLPFCFSCLSSVHLVRVAQKGQGEGKGQQDERRVPQIEKKRGAGEIGVRDTDRRGEEEREHDRLNGRMRRNESNA